jgi:hypothetical protein
VDGAAWYVRASADFAYHFPEMFGRLARRSGADEKTAALAAGATAQGGDGGGRALAMPMLIEAATPR